MDSKMPRAMTEPAKPQMPVMRILMIVVLF